MPDRAAPANESLPSAGWELFPHGADTGVRGFGPTREIAFQQAAIALTAVITDPEKVVPETRIEMSCEAPDSELLLVEWLNALVYEMAVRRMLFNRYEVSIRGQFLQARAWGETVNIARHEPAVEIKGATLTELEVTSSHDRGWVAQCIVDI